MGTLRKEGETKAQAAERLKLHIQVNSNTVLFVRTKDNGSKEPVTIWILIFEIIEGFMSFFEKKKFNEETQQFEKRTWLERLFNKDVLEAFVAIGKIIWKVKYKIIP